MLLSKAWEAFESDKRIQGFSPQTLKAYLLQLSLLIDYFKDVEITTLDTNQLKEYLAISGKHLKPASLAHRIRFLKSLFRWSHEEGNIRKNPAAKIKEPKVGKRIPKYLTEREIELLREACHLPIEKAIFEFMFSTGCRIGEIVSLEKNHINWSNQSAIVRGKGDKEREVYFNIRCDIWLKRYMDSRTDNDPAIFVTERHPHIMSVAQMRYIIKRISNRAGINKEIHPHQLRHSYATHLLNNGAPIEVIQSLLGHEKSETTRIYAQLSGRLRKEYYQKYF
ncbi:site-specific tyrosine recombinase/integron integrase [Paenisporosarcina sp. OV554]|uniref:site-specific tyrosine recombinase/integron integrase n=1 Tax=Paenisporosarcina sp. OV554 TaxID=2135694 RepID=UPI000D3B78B3|nr:site-specific tyrosine recombinase/integron integrase [Paenisporosarcina sp. OV554]PUB10585.1 integrase/recombinase XerD [Paenisporosarcina sp. OV554]